MCKVKLSAWGFLIIWFRILRNIIVYDPTWSSKQSRKTFLKDVSWLTSFETWCATCVNPYDGFCGITLQVVISSLVYTQKDHDLETALRRKEMTLFFHSSEVPNWTCASAWPCVTKRSTLDRPAEKESCWASRSCWTWRSLGSCPVLQKRWARGIIIVNVWSYTRSVMIFGFPLTS